MSERREATSARESESESARESESESEREVDAERVIALRVGHGANCSSVGSVIDTLFLSAAAGGAILAAVLAAMKDEGVTVVGGARAARQDTSDSDATGEREDAGEGEREGEREDAGEGEGS